MSHLPGSWKKLEHWKHSSCIHFSSSFCNFIISLFHFQPQKICGCIFVEMIGFPSSASLFPTQSPRSIAHCTFWPNASLWRTWKTCPRQSLNFLFYFSNCLQWLSWIPLFFCPFSCIVYNFHWYLSLSCFCPCKTIDILQLCL